MSAYEYRIICAKDGKWRWGRAIRIGGLTHARKAARQANGTAGCRCEDEGSLASIETEHYIERRSVGKWEAR